MPDVPADVVDPGSPTGQTRPRMPRWVKVFVIIGIVFAVLVILMLTGVLGKGHGPGRHLGGGMPHQTTSNTGGPAEVSEASRTVELTASDALTFVPSTIEVSAAETVTFAVTNGGKAVHEFTLGDPAMQQEHAGMMAHIPAGMGHDAPSSITLEPGETKRLAWRFEPRRDARVRVPRAGSLRRRDARPDHDYLRHRKGARSNDDVPGRS